MRAGLPGASVGYSIGKWIDSDGDGRYDTLEVETRAINGIHVYGRCIQSPLFPRPQLTPARNGPVTWAYWLNGIRTHCQSHIHTRGTLRHVHRGRGRRGQSSSHDENASRGGCECGMHRSSIKAVASRDWPGSRRVQKGGPEPMKRRTRDFRAWLVEAISWYDASAELFMPKRKGGPRRPIGYRSLRH